MQIGQLHRPKTIDVPALVWLRRMNLDIKNSSADGSQRMLNALEPGTPLPIHRHRKSSETVVCLRGHMREVFYNDCVALNIQLGQWHSVEVSYVKMSRARKCPK